MISCDLVNLLNKPVSILALSLTLGLASCGGGGDSAPAPAPIITPPDAPIETQSITGGGVKGPLANAVVTVYAFDAAQAGFKGAAVGTASTDASAAITGLALPFPLNPPYIMEFTSTPATTTDITTGMFPVITTMRTVITQASLDAGEQIYATPLTTMAVDIAVANANAGSGVGTSSAQFETALTAAAAQVVSTLGFGMDSSVNIFDTPPLINSTTAGAAEQAAVAAYRTAVEAVTAIAYQISEQSAGATTDTVLDDLAATLADNGIIDESAGTTLDSNTLQILEQDPASLPIPNTTQTVAEVQAILAAETATTGSTTITTDLTDGTITTDPSPAEIDPDIDNDGVLNADDAFPENATESVDTDGDGIGDVADPDDNNNGILDVDEGVVPAPTVTDTDGDGVEDAFPDNCINTVNPTQTNTDGDAEGDACDADDDNDFVDDTADAFPLDDTESVDTDKDGLGNAAADNDDDNDGVADSSDTGVAPAGSPSAGVACSLLIDCDGDGVFDSADFDPVDPLVTINFAPVTAGADITTDEDVAVAVTLSVTDDGVAPGPLVYNISPVAHGVLSGAAPDLIYTPDPDYSGKDGFIFTVVDGAGKISNISGVDITVVTVNDAPIIAQPGPLSVEMDEDASPIAFAAPVINASDKEGDTLTWSLSSVATKGVATVSGTGEAPTVTYVPDADTNGPDSFDVTVSDGNGGSDVITIDVTVNAKNDAPVIAVAGPFSIAENAVDTTTVGSVIAADVDGPVTGYSIVSGDTGAAFAIDASGQITVADTDAIDYESVVSFSLGITATDGTDTSATQTVVVNVSDVNDTAPVVGTAGPFNIAEDIANTTAVGSVTATDADTVGAVTAYNITAGDASGAFAISAAGQITVANTAVIDYETATSFSLTITATDSVNTSADATVVVNVSDINDTAPVVGAAGPFNIDEGVANSTLVGSVSATDADTVGAVTDYNFAGGNVGGAFAISATGDITVKDTSVIDFETATSFNLTVTATDGVNTSVGVIVVVSINDINDNAPVVGAAGPFSVAEDDANATVVGSVLATDADGIGAVTDYSITVGNTGTAFAISAGGQITVANTAAIDYETATSFDLTITATDGTNVSAGVVVIININDANDTAPVVAAGQSFNVISSASNGTVVGTVNATDVDTVGGITNFTVSPSSTFAINASGQITVLDNTALVAGSPYTLSVDATDDVNTSAPVDVTVTTVSNALPVIAQTGPLLVTMDEDSSPVSFVAPIISATDTTVPADTLTWSTPGATNGVATVSGTGATPTITYVPNDDFNGGDSFIVNVNDGTSTVGITVNVTVTSINDVPSTLGDDAGSADEDILLTTLNVLTNDSDNDGPVALSVSSFDVGSANGGIVFYNDDGTFDYTPAPDFNGEDSFNYTVTDGEDTSSASVTITVVAVNDAPVAVDDAEMAIVDALNVTGNVLTNDSDVDGPSLSITASDTVSLNGGTVSDNGNGTFNYTSASGYTGPDSFSYTVSDGLLSDTGTVNITVTPAGTTIAMTDLLGAAEGGIAGLESWVNAQSVNEYQYWKDIYDGATTFSYEDRFFSRLTAAFEIEADGGPDISLNGAGSWVNQGAFRVVTPDNGDGSMTVAVRDETDSIDLETITLSALYADISGQSIANYLDAQWQSAMFDSAATFGVNAKQVTAYTFEHDVDAYLMYSGDWCQDTDPARYATLNTTVVNNNCNGIDVPTGIDASGFATSLSQLEVSTPFVDDNDGADPDVRVGFGWEGNTTLVVEFAPGNVANYYVIDWAGSDVDHTVQVATGTYVRDTTIQGVDMIRFIPPAAAYVQFPEVMEESSGYQVSVEGGFVRLGDYILAGTARTDISGLLNGHALDDILANFSGDKYTTANLAGRTIYDMYQDTDADEYLIDVYTFDADGTFTTYDYQTGLLSEETGTWDVNTSGKLHLTMTSGPDDGVQFWAKAKSMDPDNGSQRVCYADNIAGPFKCSFLDVALGITSRQFNDETTAVNKMNKRNSLDPQLSQARTPNLKQFDGSRTRISGLWIGEFDEVSLTSGTHTLDFGEPPATLTFNIDGTGVMEFSPTEINTITSWSIDFNGVLRFTEQASDLSTADWTIGYFEAQVPGNVLVYFVGDDGGQFFVMGGFDQTLAAFDAAALAGTTQYNVSLCDDGDAGCTIGNWDLVALAFDANGSDLIVTYGGFDYPGTYSVESGVLVATFDGGTDYIRILSVDSATGANRTCWEGSLALTAECTGNGSEFMFDNLIDAQSFQTTVTFVDAGADAVTLLDGGGIYEFWDDEWDGSQEVPGYWNISLNGSTVVDVERIWSVALNKYLPVGHSNDIVLASNGWYLTADSSEEITTSTNSANLNTYDPVNTSTLLDQWNLSFEVMDIAGKEQAFYAPALGDQSAVFSTNAQLIRTTFLHNNESTDLKHWIDCGEPSYTNYGQNCNVVWLRPIDGSLNVSGGDAATDVQTFVGDTTQTIELGWDDGNGNLLGVLNAGVITLYATNFDGSPATSVGTGSYTIRTDVNGVSGLDIIDYTLPAGFENTYNLHYDEGNQGILSTYSGFWRHGEIEANGITGTLMMLNSVAGNDVLNNQPAAEISMGTWVSATISSNGDPLIQHLFGDGQYEAAGTCDFDGTEGAEHGTASWNQSTGAVSATASVSTMGACSIELGAANGNTVAISGDVLTLSIPSVGDQTYNRLTTTANPIVGTWVLNPMADYSSLYANGDYTHATLTFINDTQYILEQAVDTTNCGTSATFGDAANGAGREFGSYTWNSSTGVFTRTILADSTGDCGFDDFSGTEVFTVDGDNMYLGDPAVDGITFHRLQ